MTDDETLVHQQQQMLMARPWDAAEDRSIWEITGEYPGGRGRFVRCLAMTLGAPSWDVGDQVLPLFAFVGELGLLSHPVSAQWVTSARPLLLVLRDEPSTAYYVDEQSLLRGAS